MEEKSLKRVYASYYTRWDKKRIYVVHVVKDMIRLVLYNRDIRKQNYVLTPPALAICILPAIINSAAITKSQGHICSKSKRRKSNCLKGASL